METYTESYCEKVVLRWIGKRATRNELRRKRPGREDWKKFDDALNRLIASGVVLETYEQKLPGSPGYPPKVYMPSGDAALTPK